MSKAKGASALIPFQFENHEIRALLMDDQPWFVAADVCAVLKLSNPSESLKLVCAGALHPKARCCA